MSHQVELQHRRAIFLDRDGVINENRSDHVKSWQEFRFLPGALEALRLLSEQGYRIFIVTNQAAINRGLVSHATLEEIHGRMVAVAEAHGARIAGIRYCPHREDEACSCRKPRPGMLLGLAAERRIDTSQTFFVGDALSDVAAGRAAGCQTILVRTGRGREQLAHPDFRHHRPEHVADSLLEAVHWLDTQDHALTTQPDFLPGVWRTPARPGSLLPLETTGTI